MECNKEKSTFDCLIQLIFDARLAIKKLTQLKQKIIIGNKWLYLLNKRKLCEKKIQIELLKMKQ